MATKPTILFVHGSWHNPNHFKRVMDLCETDGYPTSCPAHPSVGHLPPLGLAEDVQCIRDELKRLIEVESRDVIVVAHSYGGVVTTEAADAEFAKAARAAKGQQGGIVGMLYMCAFLLQKGESLGAALNSADALPPFIPTDERGMCKILNPKQIFYHDLPEDEQEHWASELQDGPASAQLTPVTQMAYLYHPTTYLFCEEDQGLKIDFQRLMVEKVRQGTGAVIKEDSCTASHSPFLSQPQTVLNSIKKVLAQ